MGTTTTKAMRTPGEWHVRFDGNRLEIGTPSIEPTLFERRIAYTTGRGESDKANATTIALAGTAANAVDAMGLDGDAAIRELPSLIGQLLALEAWQADPDRYGGDAADIAVRAGAILARLRPGA